MDENTEKTIEHEHAVEAIHVVKACLFYLTFILHQL